MALVTLPMMIAVQYVSAKIGLVSGKGITAALRERLSALARTCGCAGNPRGQYDQRRGGHLGDCRGSESSRARSHYGAGGADCRNHFDRADLGFIPLHRQRLQVADALAVCLYRGGFSGEARLDRGARGTFLPSLPWNSTAVSTIVAVLGTTISPYLFFWQANQEVEEEIARGRKRLWQRRGATDGELKYAAVDVGAGMFASNVVMYFIILATAMTGKHELQSATDAAQALRPVAGNAATILMALGLIGTGMLAVPILTGSAAYAVCEALNWKCSLDAKPAKAKEFYLVLTTATLGGLARVLRGSTRSTLFFGRRSSTGCSLRRCWLLSCW